MAKKQAKEGSLDFFYLQKQPKEQPKREKKRAKNNRPSKKVKKQKQKEEIRQDIFDFDNEIVIGVNVIPKEKDKPSSKQKKKTIPKKTQKASSSIKETKEKQPIPQKKKQTSTVTSNKQVKKGKTNYKIVKRILKLVLLLAIVIAVGIFFMTTPLFNLTKIEVKGNEQIPQETIESLSGLVLDQNLFQFNKKIVAEKIKENPYIDSVKIKRNLPNGVEIQVKERYTKYMILLGNAYLYMNRQGYFLELSENTKEVPIVKGVRTSQENLVPGNRLDQTDLEKLETVNIIMKEASNNELEGSVTSIDITNKNDYILILEQEGKIAYLGDSSNMTSKILALKEIVEKEKGRNGEIFLNTDRRIFREQV